MRNLVQALGPLRDQRRDREDINLPFHRVSSPLGSRLEIIPNWNTRPAAAVVRKNGVALACARTDRRKLS